MHNQLQQCRPGFEALVADPGIMQRLKSFTQFCKENPQIAEPWDAREEFSKQLGCITVQRGLSLSLHDKKVIQREGMLASGRRIGGNLLESDYQTTIKKHLMNTPDDFLSVTSNPHIAHSIAASDAFTGGYVFTLKIPELDTLHCDVGHPFIRPAVYNKHIERFVPFYIHPDEIIAVEAESYWLRFAFDVKAMVKDWAGDVVLRTGHGLWELAEPFWEKDAQKP